MGGYARCVFQARVEYEETVGVGRNVEQTKRGPIIGIVSAEGRISKAFRLARKDERECFTGDSSDPCQGQVEKQETLIGEAQFLLVYEVLRGKWKQMRK